MTLTTATSTTSSGATITGCNFKDENSTIEIDVCTLDRQGAEATAMSQAQGSLTAKKHLALYARAADEPDWKCKRNVEDFFILIVRRQTQSLLNVAMARADSSFT